MSKSSDAPNRSAADAKVLVKCPDWCDSHNFEGPTRMVSFDEERRDETHVGTLSDSFVVAIDLGVTCRHPEDGVELGDELSIQLYVADPGQERSSGWTGLLDAPADPEALELFADQLRSAAGRLRSIQAKIAA